MKLVKVRSLKSFERLKENTLKNKDVYYYQNPWKPNELLQNVYTERIKKHVTKQIKQGLCLIKKS